MSAGPMDTLGAFSYLTDNVPVWIDRVTDLAAYTAAKHAEYTEAYKKYATAAGPRRRKNSSVCSIRTDDLLPSAQNPDAAADSVQGTGATHDLTRTPNQDCAGELVSTRHNVIIHYDGYTQQALEEIVRNIGTARNNIRRGKMSQLPSVGFRSSRSCMPGNGPPDLSSIRSARNRGPPGPQKETALDLVDKQLEVAHGLCESAAYQFLRAGDCKSELSSVEEKFGILLGKANVEVQRMKAAQKSEPSEPEAEKEKEEPKIQSLSTSVVQPTTTTKPQTSPTEAATATTTIEVDDASSVSMESIDLTAFRANRVNRIRA